MHGFKNVNNLKNGLLYSFISLSILGGLILVSPQKANAAILLEGGYNNVGCSLDGAHCSSGIPAASSTAILSGTPAWVEVYITENNLGALDVGIRDLTNGNDCSSQPQMAYASSTYTGTGYKMIPITYVQGDLISGTKYGLCFLQSGFPADKVGSLSNTTTGQPWFRVLDAGGDPSTPTDTTTHFNAVYPQNGTTTATTTQLGANLYANIQDFYEIGVGYGRLHIKATQPSLWACQNSGAVYDAVYTCGGSNYPSGGFTYDFGTTTITGILAGLYDYSTTYTFPQGGQWQIEYDIQQISQPWYCLTLCTTYTTIVSTTTTIIVGQPLPMDTVREVVGSTTRAINNANLSGIGAILASTTASIKSACSIISSGFNMGDCLTLMIYPGQDAISDDILIITHSPPLGYIFRFRDILVATTSTTTLPTISYDFASSSPMSAIGTIHFDPFGTMTQAAAIISEAKSDRAQPMTVWQIMDPFITVFIYLVLLFQIIHDLTGIHDHDNKIKSGRDNSRL